jgi:hypothetical protein
VGFNVIHRLIIRILQRKWVYNGAVHQLFIDFKKAYNTVMEEVLDNIFIINYTYTEVHTGERFHDACLIQNSLDIIRCFIITPFQPWFRVHH